MTTEHLSDAPATQKTDLNETMLNDAILSDIEQEQAAETLVALEALADALAKKAKALREKLVAAYTADKEAKPWSTRFGKVTLVKPGDFKVALDDAAFLEWASENEPEYVTYQDTLQDAHDPKLIEHLRSTAPEFLSRRMTLSEGDRATVLDNLAIDDSLVVVQDTKIPVTFTHATPGKAANIMVPSATKKSGLAVAQLFIEANSAGIINTLKQVESE